jgi:hypothetical protein
MKKDDNRFVFTAFVVWRISLCLILAFAIGFIALQKDFLGGGLENYLANPQLWSWANFDGEHLLSISLVGYKPLQYFFFPAYPFLVSFVAKLFYSSTTTHLITGLVISHAALLMGLIGLIRLTKLDYKKNIARLSLILLLLFPTSFYFGAFYTESLFFALSVWSFYFARKGRWLVAGALGAVLAATRVVGLALIPALIVEAWMQGGRGGLGEVGKKVLGIVLVPLGIVVYMVYLNKVVGDPLEFFHSVGIYGEQRSTELIMLPRIFYRYIVKILPNINYNYFPAVFSTWLEFLVGLGFGVLGGLGILEWIGRLASGSDLRFKEPCGSAKSSLARRGGLGVVSWWFRRGRTGRMLDNFKIRESYLVYLLVGYIIPTLSGSFSSLPRYVLILFPAFIMLSKLLSCGKERTVNSYYLLSAVTLFIATALFVRGYWIS